MLYADVTRSWNSDVEAGAVCESVLKSTHSALSVAGMMHAHSFIYSFCLTSALWLPTAPTIAECTVRARMITIRWVAEGAIVKSGTTVADFSTKDFKSLSGPLNLSAMGTNQRNHSFSLKITRTPVNSK